MEGKGAGEERVVSQMPKWLGEFPHVLCPAGVAAAGLADGEVSEKQ